MFVQCEGDSHKLCLTWYGSDSELLLWVSGVNVAENSFPECRH